MWKSTVITASDRIFPGLVYYNQEKQLCDTGNCIKSNLPLQMTLYFNVWLFPIWILIMLLGLNSKYYNLSVLHQFITITIYILIVVLECIRLYFGYVGNLSDKIPELACFWLISALLQFPLMGFILLDGNMLLFLIERVSTSMMILLVTMEIITGAIALKIIAECHSKKFYMAQLCGTAPKFN
ncbi:hypothetical protein PV325_005118 [Microctonus aethiopoides]|nr:hypothetical protein PV325_005118 [Microctonus aethiopoides]KAK0099121.1 hypothetical protein PV326_006585 [Microctonus aethiopoides]